MRITIYDTEHSKFNFLSYIFLDFRTYVRTCKKEAVSYFAYLK